MNFYAEQDDARKKTKYLVFLFVLAVIALTVITSLIVAAGFWIADGQFKDYGHVANSLMAENRKPVSEYFSWENFGKISLFVSGTIFCVILFKWIIYNKKQYSIQKYLVSYFRERYGRTAVFNRTKFSMMHRSTTMVVLNLVLNLVLVQPMARA